MVAVIYQKDHRSGITYAYESAAYWDKDRQQSRAKRKLIGRVDPKTGEIVPTDGRGRKKQEDTPPVRLEPAPTMQMARSFYGATYLLDAIGEKLGLTLDLKQCFPDRYRQILSLAYYLILEDNNPLYRFERWSYLHKHPFGQVISSQRSSELFASISEEDKFKFFRLQGRRRLEKEYWAYDITTFSSYSESLRQVQYGWNKEHDRLPQFNLALVFGEKSHLPFYYRKLAGNIPDSKTLRHLLADIETLGYTKVKLVMDRGFYSEDNINALFKEHLKFLISVKMSLNFVHQGLDLIYDDFRNFEQYSEDYELYSQSVRAHWRYTQFHPYKNETTIEKRRIYLHFYYNPEQATEKEKAFDKMLVNLRRELESGQRNLGNEAKYKKYFSIKSTPKRGNRVTVNDEAIRKAKRYFGFFALMTNEKMDAIVALEIYRNKDLVEKAFGNLKERLNLRRTLVSSEQSLDGKLFVQFVALIYLSYIKKQMQGQGLFARYTLQGLLDKLDVIECFESPGCELRVGEMLEEQKELYRRLGVEPPTSL